MSAGLKYIKHTKNYIMLHAELAKDVQFAYLTPASDIGSTLTL